MLFGPSGAITQGRTKACHGVAAGPVVPLGTDRNDDRSLTSYLATHRKNDAGQPLLMYHCSPLKSSFLCSAQLAILGPSKRVLSWLLSAAKRTYFRSISNGDPVDCRMIHAYVTGDRPSAAPRPCQRRSTERSLQ